MSTNDLPSGGAEYHFLTAMPPVAGCPPGRIHGTPAGMLRTDVPPLPFGYGTRGPDFARQGYDGGERSLDALTPERASVARAGPSPPATFRLPRRLGVHRLIWRDFCCERAALPTAPSPTEPEVIVRGQP